MILAKIRRDAESYLGESVTEAVITVPAYFDDSQRKATQDAGRIAGLNVLRIINEPTAAAVAYGLDNEAAQKILVYDLGGGTFDVSIIEIEDGTFTVLATGGDTHLGGDDFDQRIVEYAVAEFKKSDRIDLTRDPAAMGRLKEEAEKAKKELSSAPSAQLNLPFIAVGKDGPHHLDIALSRPQFEMMTGDLLSRTVTPVQNALRDAGISASQLGKVLLVGGSTRMPAVERQVRELLGKEPSHSLNPDECVAMGAAVQGALLQGGGKLAGATGAAAQGLVLMDVTPLTLSIETLGGVATPLITRNSMIPTRKSQIFTVEIPAAAQVGGTVGAALEEEREVEALVVERRSETVDDLRHRGVADPRHVGLGDLAVVVEVFVADVAGTQLLLVQAELRIVVGHVVQFLLREEVHGTVAHGQSVTHAALILPRIGIVLAVVDHLVAGKGEVSADGDGEVFAETLDVFGRNLEAAVLHQTHVGVVGIILGKPRNLRELGCEEDVFCSYHSFQGKLD